MQPLGILETSIYVDNLEAAEEFYSGVLQLQLHSARENRHVFYRCGSGMLLIFNPRVSRQLHDQEIPAHGCDGTGHVAFAIEPDAINGWREQLAQRGVAIEHEETWPHGGHSLYFRDPAGNSIELATPNIWDS